MIDKPFMGKGKVRDYGTYQLFLDAQTLQFFVFNEWEWYDRHIMFEAIEFDRILTSKLYSKCQSRFIIGKSKQHSDRRLRFGLKVRVEDRELLSEIFLPYSRLTTVMDYCQTEVAACDQMIIGTGQLNTIQL